MYLRKLLPTTIQELGFVGGYFYLANETENISETFYSQTELR